MCTVTYLPTGSGSFLLASNRDESKSRRPGLPPDADRTGDIGILRPTDSEAGGTWISLSENGIAFALMNDYQTQYHSGEKVTSRGDIIPAVADCMTAHDVAGRLEMVHEFRFRPFRLLMASALQGVFRWSYNGQTLTDGHEGYGAGLWVSAGGEERRVLTGRRKMFERYLAKTDVDNLDRIKEMHVTRDVKAGEYSFCVDLEQVQTVSATIAEFHSNRTVRMHYMDAPLSLHKEWQTCSL